MHYTHTQHTSCCKCACVRARFGFDSQMNKVKVFVPKQIVLCDTYISFYTLPVFQIFILFSYTFISCMNSLKCFFLFTLKRGRESKRKLERTNIILCVCVCIQTRPTFQRLRWQNALAGGNHIQNICHSTGYTYHIIIIGHSDLVSRFFWALMVFDIQC